MIKIPSVEDIRFVVASKGYKYFDNPKGLDINIIGIRSEERKANKFDDLITVSYMSNGQTCYLYFDATTDPGTHWLENPMNVLGTGIVKPGQYPGSHQIGMHQNKYEALVQRGNMTVYRDNTKDNIIDTSGPNVTEETGVFGGNIHRASRNNKSIQVDKWSAMCQVIADPNEFEIFMAVCRTAAARYGNSFTYTLLEARDFF